jgi:hypothetical protein
MLQMRLPVLAARDSVPYISAFGGSDPPPEASRREMRPGARRAIDVVGGLRAQGLRAHRP